MKGLDIGESCDVVDFAPLCEAAGGICIRLARVIVVELGGEEFYEALDGLWRRREQRGKDGGERERGLARSYGSRRSAISWFLFAREGVNLGIDLVKRYRL